MSVSSYLYFCFIQVPVDLFISVGSFSSYKSFSLLNFLVFPWELFSFSQGKTKIFKRLVYLQVLRIKQRISGSLEFFGFSEVFPNFSVLLELLVFPWERVKCLWETKQACNAKLPHALLWPQIYKLIRGLPCTP